MLDWMNRVAEHGQISQAVYEYVENGYGDSVAGDLLRTILRVANERLLAPPTPIVEETKAAEAVPVKRKPGRPRKIPLIVDPTGIAKLNLV